VEDIEAAAYLTQRLRKLEPEGYERELERSRRTARLQGIFLGSSGSLAVLLVGFFLMSHYMPNLMATLLAGLQ
jgi:hypothetical protein